MSMNSPQNRQIPMAFPRVFLLPAPVIGLAYLAGYVLLDWVSFIHPIASYGITPWNPPTGLSFVLILLFGQRFIPFLFVAPLLADLVVRRFALSWQLEFVTVAIIGAGYSLALIYLSRPKTRFDPALGSMGDLLLLLLVAAVSAAMVGVAYVGTLMFAGVLSPEEFLAAVLRFWVGDVIGIAVVAPFAQILLTRGRLPRPSLETVAQAVAVLVALALVFGYAEQHHFQLFYLLFLPIVWIAVRTGLEGVTLGLLATQIGLILGVQLLPAKDVDVTAFQALMLVLAMTGLIAGALVTEHRRTENQLRLHQDSLARLTRLGSMGELAAAVAHEINQPLMAAGT
jgi:integral membrane sensor domain MASE1